MAEAGTDIAVREEGRQMAVLTNEQLQYIAGTEFVPPGLRGNLPAILACVATGRALGIADMSALRSIHIIDGKATFSAELMVQLVRRAGHSVTGEVGADSATVTGTRADNGDTMTCTWTLEMAERAGLLSKQNWRRYPEAMLWARAASQLCRMLFADCFAGATYTPEELEDSGGEPQATSHLAASQPPIAEPASPPEPLITAPQKKKANVLVGTLRDDLRITTSEVYVAAGRPTTIADGGELHWAPLRDSLTKKEASDLIDRLERYDASGEKQPPLDEWRTELGPEHASASAPAATTDAELPSGPITQLRDELLEIADMLGNRDLVEQAIAKNRDANPLDVHAHADWLRKQLVLARQKAAA